MPKCFQHFVIGVHIFVLSMFVYASFIFIGKINIVHNPYKKNLFITGIFKLNHNTVMKRVLE